jgi:hypothetical protein
MTRPLPFTKARLRRAIEAVREAGLHVTGILPDGTLLVGENTLNGSYARGAIAGASRSGNRGR